MTSRPEEIRMIFDFQSGNNFSEQKIICSRFYKLALDHKEEHLHSGEELYCKKSSHV